MPSTQTRMAVVNSAATCVDFLHHGCASPPSLFSTVLVLGSRSFQSSPSFFHSSPGPGGSIYIKTLFTTPEILSSSATLSLSFSGRITREDYVDSDRWDSHCVYREAWSTCGQTLWPWLAVEDLKVSATSSLTLRDASCLMTLDLGSVA